jgi:hypothetical protein
MDGQPLRRHGSDLWEGIPDMRPLQHGPCERVLDRHDLLGAKRLGVGQDTFNVCVFNLVSCVVVGYHNNMYWSGYISQTYNGS